MASIKLPTITTEVMATRALGWKSGTGVVVGDGATAGGVAVGALPADDTITNAKLANVATATIKGRITAGTGDPQDLTATQAREIIEAGASAAVTVSADRNPLLSSDAGKTLLVNGAYTITITDATAFGTDKSCIVRNIAGSAVNVTIAQGSGATVNIPTGQALTIPRFGAVEIYCYTANAYVVNGKTNAS